MININHSRISVGVSGKADIKDFRQDFYYYCIMVYFYRVFLCLYYGSITSYGY